MAEFFEMRPNYQVDMMLDPEDSATALIKVQMPENTWVGFALGGGSMAPGTDMVQIDSAQR